MRPPLAPPPRGLTLIELLMALALLGVLSLLALPGYQQHWQRARRGEAMQRLLALQQAQARHRSDHPRYADDLSTLGLSPEAPPGRYRLRLVTATALGFSAEALALNAQLADRTCRRWLLVVEAGEARHRSVDADGRDSTDRCWPQ